MPTTLLQLNAHFAGVDEVGRGCLAGPVCAAAVVLSTPIAGLKDSKQLSQKQREFLAKQIKRQANTWAIGWSNVSEINQQNILQASLLAMRRAIASLAYSPNVVLIDGNIAPQKDSHYRCIVSGDTRIANIAAASILAKVTRDRYMRMLSLRFADYGFEKHKGYSTAQHLQALHACGPCSEHRKTFAPVQKLLSV